MLHRSGWLLATAVCAATAATAPAATIIKADNALPLADPASWVGSAAPTATDTARFDATLTGPLSAALGGDLSILTLQVADPAGPITLHGTNALSLTGGVGIDMAAATAPVTLDAPVVIARASVQSWVIGNTLALNGGLTSTVTTPLRGLSLSGGGTLLWGGASNFDLPTTAFSTTINGITVKLGSATALNFAAHGMNSTSTASTFDLAGYHATIGGYGGMGAITNSGPTAVTLTMAGNAGPIYLFTGTISDGTGGLSLTQTGASTLRLAGANTYSGATTVANGLLSLSFAEADAPAADIVSSASPLVLAGGGLTVQNGMTRSTSQTFNNTTVKAGGAAVAVTSSTSSSITATLHLGTITRQAGGVVRFAGSSTGQVVTNSPLVSGILGGWAIAGSVGSDWATTDANGVIGPLAAAAYVNASTGPASFGPGIHTSIDSSLDLAGAAPDLHTASLRYIAATSSTLTLHGANVIDSGGILLAGNLVASNVFTVTGGTSLTSGNGQDLIVSSSGKSVMAVATPIVDHGATPIGLTVDMPFGTLTLAAGNTYSGGTVLLRGALAVNAGASLGTGDVQMFAAVNGPRLTLANAVSLPNDVVLRGVGSLFGASMIDVAPGGAATLAGRVTTDTGSGDQYRIGTSGGTLTLTGSHVAGAAGSPPVMTTFWGSTRTNGAPLPRIIFGATGSLEAYGPPIQLSYVDLVLRDSATITHRSRVGPFGLRMGMGLTFANYQGANILTLRDNARLDLADGALDLNNNPSYGASTLNLDGGSLILGRFTLSNATLATTLRFNGGTVVAAKDAADFLPALAPATANSFMALVGLGGAKFDTGGHAVTVGASLLHDPALGSSFDGGIVKTGPGTLTLGGTLTYSGPTLIEQGTLRVAGAGTVRNGFFGGGTLEIASGVAVTSGRPIRVHTLRIDGSMTVRPGLGQGTTTKVHELVLAESGGTYAGRLRMHYGNVVVQATDAADKAAKIAMLRSAITAGLATGAAGITFDNQAASPETLAVALFDNAALGLTDLLGTPVDGHSLLITTAPIGDATLDGKVDAFDLNALAAHWQQPAGAVTSDGDFDLDGKVDAFDLNMLAAHWQQGAAGSLSFEQALTAAFSAAVPEPASLALLGAGLLLLPRRAQKKRRTA